MVPAVTLVSEVYLVLVGGCLDLVLRLYRSAPQEGNATGNPVSIMLLLLLRIVLNTRLSSISVCTNLRWHPTYLLRSLLVSQGNSHETFVLRILKLIMVPTVVPYHPVSV